MPQLPRSDFDFEKTFVCFKSKLLTCLTCSSDKSLVLEFYICCKCSGKGISSCLFVVNKDFSLSSVFWCTKA